MATRQPNLSDQFRGSLHREAMSDQITERVLSLIREQHLHPGDKLPPERELASLMGVSRATVREALRSLSMMNVVELRHGSGTFVTSLETELLVERFDMVFSLNDNSFLDLIEARKIIEPGATFLAVQRITEEETARFEAILVRSWHCLKTQPIEFPKLDVEFHMLMAECSHNALLTRIMQAVARLSIASSQRTTFSVRGEVDPAGVERAIRAHQNIVDAIKAHDPDLARDRMAEHLQSVEGTLRELKTDS